MVSVMEVSVKVSTEISPSSTDQVSFSYLRCGCLENLLYVFRCKKLMLPSILGQ